MEKQRISPGLYRVIWKTGQASLVSIGMGANGDMWFAPTNWIAPDNRIPWEEMKSCEKLDIAKEPLESVEITLSGAKVTNSIEVDWLSDRMEWIKDKAKEFEAQYDIFDSPMLDQFITFVLSGGKKFPYIEGDKLVFDMSDKATYAAIHEYAKASVFHGYGSEKYIGEKCNHLLSEITKFQNKNK